MDMYEDVEIPPEDFAFLNQMLNLWVSNNSSLKEKLEGGVLTDSLYSIASLPINAISQIVSLPRQVASGIQSSVRSTYEFGQSLQCSYIELFVIMALVSLVAFMYLVQFSQKKSSSVSESIAKAYTKINFSEISRIIPKFVKQSWGTILSKLGQEGIADFGTASVTGILQLFSNNVIPLLNEIALFNVRQWITWDFYKDKFEDNVATALTLTNLAGLGGLVTRAQFNLFLYCFVIKLLFQYPPKVCIDVLYQALGKMSRKPAVAPEILAQVEEIRKDVDAKKQD